MAEEKLRRCPAERRRTSPRGAVVAPFAFDLEVSLPVTFGAPAGKWSRGGKKHLTGIRSVTPGAADDRRDIHGVDSPSHSAAPFAADHLVEGQGH